MRGKFVTIEGGDGSGKSTHLAQIIAALSPAHAIISTREPTARLPSQAAHPDWRISSAAYALDRAEHSRNVIVPALERGEHVLCDRYLLSNVANTVAQAVAGPGGDSGWDAIRHLARVENPAVLPDAVIVLDAPDAVLDTRIAARVEQGKASAADVAAWRDEMRGAYRRAVKLWNQFGQLEATRATGSFDRTDAWWALYTPYRNTEFYAVDTSGAAEETHARLLEIVGEVLNG